jgi:peptidoglycan hydrolase CwlO-like protein
MHKKQHNTTSQSFIVRWKRGIMVAISGIALGALIAAPVVHADVYQQQITELDNANTSAQDALSGLQSTASSYQQAIADLQTQISAIEGSIATNQAAENADNAQIASDQAQVTQNKAILADDLKTMYVSGQMSTIEELATSKNLSDYVDSEKYRSLVQDKVTSLLQTIQGLEAQAQQQKDQVETLLSTEQSQQAQVAADEAQQSQLLGANQSQQDQYNQQISSNNSQISKLRSEQAAANASVAKSVKVSVSASSGSGNGGYPAAWCDAAQDAITDSNGFPNRECTSFAYWYFTTQEGQSSFRVSGNAGWWWETSNYAVSTYPDVKVGALGIEPSSSLNAPVPSLHGGYYGHVMVVLALPGTTYNGSFPHTSAAAGTTVPATDVLVMSMNEDEEGHFMYNLWPADDLMYINPQ